MAAGPTRAVAVACCAAATLAIAIASPLTERARAQGSTPAPAVPTGSPLAGDGMWIWYVKRADGGKVKRIVRRARRRGIETVLIKAGDAGKSWSQFTPRLVRALKARGLRVCAWQFVYGSQPSTEADIGARAVRKGADCLVIDAEGHYEGKYAQASTYISKLRSQIGPDYPLALAAFPYADFHPAFPYSVFLGPGGAQYNLPQLYWKTIGTSVDEAFVHTYVWNRVYNRPIMPLGQTYLNPSKRDIKRLRALALAYGMQGVSWWSWQHSGKRQWNAVGGGVKPLAGHQTHDSYPSLRVGAKGDVVAWAQQLLAGGGYTTEISGYYEQPTVSAVLAFQASRGLPQTGSIDFATWPELLKLPPLPVRWTNGGGAVAASKGGAMAEPRSAELPALDYEIPRRSRRASSR